MNGQDTGKRRWQTIEKVLFVIGLIMLALYGASHLYTTTASRIAVLRFKNSPVASPAETSLARKQLRDAKGQLDFSSWSGKRILAYREALTMNFAPPLAILCIPKLRLEVPVFDGTNELILNRGAGRITGTARPGEAGNIGIAAHRDGFFRGLKEIRLGDRIELLMHSQKLTYVVDKIVIVSPDDVQVLKPRLRPSLTLVTCYPFYFVGDAPRRYIVCAYEAKVSRGRQS